MGFFDKIKSGLTKTRKAMASSLGSVFSFSEINDDFYDELEECLILGDLGVNTAVKAVDALRARVKAERLKSRRGRQSRPPGNFDADAGSRRSQPEPARPSRLSF